jgi:hypothetical protein
MGEHKCPFEVEQTHFLRRQDLASLAQSFIDALAPLSTMVGVVQGQSDAAKRTEKTLRVTNWSIMFLNAAVLLVLGTQVFVLHTVKDTATALKSTSARLEALERSSELTQSRVAAASHMYMRALPELAVNGSAGGAGKVSTHDVLSKPVKGSY